MDQKEQINWTAVVVYYLLACAISWPFFWWRDLHPESFQEWDLHPIVRTWSFMWGPGIATFVVVVLLYRNQLKMDHITLFGNSVLQSLLCWFVPFIMLAIPGLPNTMGVNPHVFPIVFMGILGFISIVGEDSGWAYFLKNMLIKIPTLKRSILIGALWELWHFTNRTAHKTPMQAVLSVLFMMCFLILLTYIMSKITDRTKSLVTVVTIHMWFNVLVENGCTAVYIVFGLSLVFWTVMYLSWDKPFWNKFKIRRDSLK